MSIGADGSIEDVRQIATTWDGNRVVVGAFEGRVAVWDLRRKRKVSEFDAMLDFGGERLAITRDGRSVVVGAYRYHGISCYDADSGELKWQRKDLKKVQQISISADDKHVFCCFQLGATQGLDLQNGKELARVAGVEMVCASPFDGSVLWVKGRKPAELHRLGRRGATKFSRRIVAVHNVAFSPTRVMFSSVGYSLTCFDLKTGNVAWEHPLDEKTSAYEVAYDEEKDVFIAVARPELRDGPQFVMRIEAGTGTRIDTWSLDDRYECGFCSRGSQLLLSDGRVFSTRNGRVLKKLDFPYKPRPK